jgi:hypothetical protein
MYHIRSPDSEARSKPLIIRCSQDLLMLSVFKFLLNKYCTIYTVGTFESVGKSELQNAGKAGLVTIQGKISVVLGTVLISKTT